jgi:predicted N-acyltransferase
LNDHKDELIKKYKSSLRRDISKGRAHLTVHESTDSSLFYHFIASSYIRKGLSPSFSEGVFKRIFEESLKKNIAYAIVSKDENGASVGGIFCVQDHDALYYLFGGIDSSFNTRGSQSLLMHTAILHAMEQKKDFDFEGSMNEGIDRFFMSFNPEIIPYHRISKSNSKLFKIKKAIF